MTHKKTTYIDDIKATAGDKFSREKLKQIAEDLKAVGREFIPSEKYKTQLKKRLESIHVVDNALDTPPGFSFLRVFSTVFSFVFVAGVVFMVHDTRQSSMQDILHNEAIITPGISSESMRVSEKLGEDNEPGDNRALEESIAPSPEENDQEVVPTQSEIQEINPSKGETRSISEPNMKESKNTEITTPQNTEGNSFAIEKSGDNGSQEVEYGVPESMFLRTSGEDETMPEGAGSTKGASMMMDAPEEEPEDFSEICEKYDGEPSEDKNSCKLQDGTICKQDEGEGCFENTE